MYQFYHLRAGDCVGISACSNPPGKAAAEKLPALLERLRSFGLLPVVGDCVYRAHPSGKERADELAGFFCNPAVRAIFDISGGDLSNEILEYLDFSAIREHPKPFWGYSDLTAVLNAVYTETGNPGCLYQIRNLVSKEEKRQTEAFMETILQGGIRLFDAEWKFLQGDAMEGVAVGGNIRCLLKLAGTPYFPDMDGKLLFLESRSGGEALIRSFFCQLRQMGVFSRISGLLLGTFTEYEQTPGSLPLETLAPALVRLPGLPVAKTQQIGHAPDSLALAVGERLTIRKS